MRAGEEDAIPRRVVGEVWRCSLMWSLGLLGLLGLLGIGDLRMEGIQKEKYSLLSTSFYRDCRRGTPHLQLLLRSHPGSIFVAYGRYCSLD
jgi:hypothetical protein